MWAVIATCCFSFSNNPPCEATEGVRRHICFSGIAGHGGLTLKPLPWNLQVLNCKLARRGKFNGRPLTHQRLGAALVLATDDRKFHMEEVKNPDTLLNHIEPVQAKRNNIICLFIRFPCVCILPTITSTCLSNAHVPWSTSTPLSLYGS